MNAHVLEGDRRRIYADRRDDTHGDVELVRASSQAAGALARCYGLTAHKEDVVRLTFEGNSVPRISKLLRISPDTVKAHLKCMFLRTDVHSRVGLAMRAAAALNGATTERSRGSR